MLKQLVVLLIGALLGANVVYYVMTRGERTQAARSDRATSAPVTDAIAPNEVAAQDAPDQPIAASPPAVSPTVVPTPNIAGLIVPVSGVAPSQLSDTFGDARGSERAHEALDIMAPTGTPVLAVADGSVEKLFDSKQGGLTIYQFEPSGRYAYYYAHLQSFAPGLAEKKAIRQGEVIGYVGSTGNASPAAPHLHFAIFVLGPERQWWKGTPINPYPLLGGR
ncbi:MAG: peptidoglycan DD-metalloendopeptidase family protein [Luteimonas sp.]|nr:peptidoglycan DD-metalloendopeptidase family protein [Luteimonas sp.]